MTPQPLKATRKTASLALWALVCLLLGCAERRQARLLQEADEKMARSDYSEAAEVLKRAVAIHPESRTAVKALYKLGFLRETYLRDFEGALFNYNEFVRLSTDPVSAYEVRKRIANLYFDQTGDPDKAADAYKTLLHMNPDSLEGDFFQFRVGQSYFRMNEFEKAREEFQKLIERYGKSPLVARTRFEIGNTYYMEGRYDVALEALKQVVRYHPLSEFVVEAQFLSAQCLEHLDRVPAALQAYEALSGRYSPESIVEMRIQELNKRVKKLK